MPSKPGKGLGMPAATAQSSSPPALALPTLLEGDERIKATEAISFHFGDLFKSKRCFLRAAWTLNRQGVIVLKAAASADLVAALNREVAQVLEDASQPERSGIDEIAYLNLPNRRVLKGYNTFVDADRPVINYRVQRPDGRSGSDAGMVDIFHPERLSSAMNNLVQACLHERQVQRLVMASCLTPVRVKCRNLYVNRGVQDTRGYHCDGRSLKFKSFVFLSEVGSLDIGPYCYVPSSHRDRRSWKRSRAFNEEHGIGTYEYSQLDDTTALPLFASPGDMVISSQRGAHRGHPQHPEAERSVLVNMYQR